MATSMHEGFSCTAVMECPVFGAIGRLLLWPLLFAALPAFSQPAPSDQYSYARRYVPGEVDEYEIRVRTEGNDAELIAVTSHETVLVDGVPYQRVRWLRATESKKGDLSALVELIPAYDFSLHPEGRLELFEPQADPVIVELATDLYAFFQALSAPAGMGRLSRVGDEYDNPEPLTGDFSGEADFPIGEDIYSQRLRFVSLDRAVATYQANAFPPAKPAIEMHREWMQPPVCGSGPNNFRPNNFQMVQRRAQGFVVAWGCEEFHITSKVDRESGRILSASMEDTLRWRVKFCSDEQLSDCIDRPDFARRRQVALMLKPRHEMLTSDQITVDPTDGLAYVLVPAGSFEMGCVRGDAECYEEEEPRHRVRISKPFWLGRTEVTVEAYEQFCEATGRPMPVEPGSGEMPGFNADWRLKDHPMVKVSWNEARAFCEWSGGRLPTEAEWEYAARGGADGLKYPWGNDRSHDEANFWRTGGRDRWKHTAPTASFFPNGFGLYDMAGNVYEWVADWYDGDYYNRSPAVDPRGPGHGDQRVARGGPGFINPRVLRTSSRLRVEPDARRVYVGFRCARETE